MNNGAIILKPATTKAKQTRPLSIQRRLLTPVKEQQPNKPKKQTRVSSQVRLFGSCKESKMQTSRFIIT